LTSCQKDGSIDTMKAMAVGEFKTHFSDVLGEVMSGKKVGVLYGRAKKPVAMLVPYSKEKKVKRKIGILEGKMSVKFADDFTITDEELINKKDGLKYIW